MAADRSRRSNAGSRMNHMIQAEDEDDFYKTTYGGFEEVAEDNDYSSEVSDSESTDSDFSIDENDEAKSDGEDDEPKRKRRVVTKAYKEPKREEKEDDEKKKKKKEEVKKEKKKKKKEIDDISSVQIYTSPERKSVRRSTALKSQQTQSRQKRREEHHRILTDIAEKKNMKVDEMRRLTQEELLAEAKITEQINLKSLETYEKLELEKKRTRVQKHVYRGPIIRYHSVTMPLITSLEQDDINVDENEESETKQLSDNIKPEMCSRTFITFTDQSTYHEIFPPKESNPNLQHRSRSSKRGHSNKSICPVTQLPAKYFDPITSTPYATLQAFRLIREAYAKQLATSNNSRKDPQPCTED